ncbi:MAG: four helix bundle protein [bacterium]
MPDSFNKLDVWKLSYDLTMEIYKVTGTFPSSEQYE